MAHTPAAKTQASHLGRKALAFLAVLFLGLGACNASPAAGPSSSAGASPASASAGSIATERLVVAFGDSFADPGGWPAVLADMLAKESGGSARVGGFSCPGGCGGSEVQRLTTLAGTVRDLASADLIVVQPQPGFNVLPVWRSYAGGACGRSDGRDCIRRSIQTYRAYVNELLDTIMQLSPADAAIRVILANAHGVRMWNGTGMDYTYDLEAADPELFDVFVEQYRGIMNQAAEAAAERCIPVFDANSLFVGADYRGKYPHRYTRDGAHPSAEANRLIAEHLMALGSDPRIPGCEAIS